MTFIFEDCREGESEGATKSFKTLRGATNYGARLFKAYGYFAADRYEGPGPWPKHIVAEWKDYGRLLGKVWT